MSTVPALVARAAAWYGDRPAVSDEHTTRSFRDVDRRSNRLAHALLALSPEPGGRVAVLSGNRAELVEIDFAISKAGKVRVPVNTRLTEPEVRYVVGDAGADVVIADPPRLELASALIRPGDSAVQHVIGLAATSAGDDPAAAAGRRGGPHRYGELLAAGREVAPDLPHPPEAGNFILYTSGTTGHPKGALATNRSRLAATQAMLTEELDVPAGGAVAHAGSMAHGSGSKVLAYLLRGARNIPVPKWDPEQFLDLVERERVSGTFLVPTMLGMLVEAAGARRRDLSSLRSVSYGGAPIPPAQLRAAVELFGAALVQVYGSCEAPHPVFVLTGPDHLALAGRLGEVAPVGRETLHTEVRLVTSDGREAAAGEAGEMWVRGPNVMAGYWRNPEATASVLDPDGWYRTGDIAWRDEARYHYIVDRSRDMIITGGLNVYPAEVENAIHQHPAVADVAVIGVPDPVWGESVKALVVRRTGATLTGDEVVAYCRRSLAGYKKPRLVEFVDALPKGATGKTLKRELRATHLARHA